MKVYRQKPKIRLSHSKREGRKFIELSFSDNDAIRVQQSKQQDIQFSGGKAYLPSKSRSCKNAD